MTFNSLGIIDPILKALEKEGYQSPTPIQEQAIPILLRRKDLMGCAQTGTGKTAAFAIPILQHLYLDRFKDNDFNKIKALIVTPTRELAIQIADSFTAYGKFTNIKNTVIFGGVKQGKQVKALKAGVEILVATPGRLLDLMQQRVITLEHIKYFVLDEADHMLDMGFIHDIKKIIAKLPSERQSLFFSATMPPDIVDLSKRILGDFDRVTVRPEQATADKVEQSVYFVSKKSKPNLLIHLLEAEPVDNVLVFSRTKHGANKIVKILAKAEIVAEAIHGNKSQNARQKALANFKSGDTRVLIATDIAARGIDVDELSSVINYDLPNVSETYVHRIGRTGRAGMSGVAISFCDKEERPFLKDIEKLIKQDIPVVKDHPFVHDSASTSDDDDEPKKTHRHQRSNTNNGQAKPGGNKNFKKRRRPNSNWKKRD